MGTSDPGIVLARILSDPRLTTDDDDAAVMAEYRADNPPQAIYRLVDRFGWQPVFERLVALLRDDTQAAHWETIQIVLFYAAGEHPMPANPTIALLYHRFPGGIDDGDRIWAIVRRLKGLDYDSDYDPMADPAVLDELNRLQRV